MLHLTYKYITFSPRILDFLFLLFLLFPLSPPPDVLFLGDMGCVSMYATDVMKTLYKKLSCAIQNGYGITF